MLPSFAVQTLYWSPPLSSLYKVNVDAVTFKDIRSTGIGVVICDNLGKVTTILCRKLEAPFDPLEAESKEGILFALCHGCTVVVLEGD